jgi:hypothetical protein
MHELLLNPLIEANAKLPSHIRHRLEKGKGHILFRKLERATGFEPATPSLGSLYSTI